MSAATDTLLSWVRSYFGDCGLNVDATVLESFADERMLTVRLHDLDTGILWRFEVSREVCVRHSASAESCVRAYFEERELRLRQATFYVEHCREILRAVERDRNERYLRLLLDMNAKAQA